MTRPTLLFLFKNKGAQLFLIWVIFWISIWKLSWVFRGIIDVRLENDFWLPKSSRSAQIVENSYGFFQCFLYLIQIFAKVQNDEENEGAEAASGSSWWGMDYSSMLNKAVSSVSIATTAAALNAAELAKQKVRNWNWNSFQHYWQFRIHFHLELVFFSYP